MAPLGVLQQQKATSHPSKNSEAGLLSRLFGSLHSGRRTGSSSALPRQGSGSAWSASCTPISSLSAVLPPGGSVACTAVAVSQSVGQNVCTTAPFLNYQTGIEQKYIFGRELGKGGNGVVRVVTSQETGEEFACKSIKKVLTDASDKKKQGHLDSIRREVQVLTKLKGSLNIVKLEDVYEDEENVHIVMEYCKGGELVHRIGDRHYSERTVASFMRAVLRTLAQCHAQNILHRDIKPGNFMLLSGDDRAPLKAIDFGLAAPFDPDHLPRTDLGLEGTPWYMAPETLRGDWYPASDLWAAGVMAFQLLCGRFPFDDKKNSYAPAITAVWRSVLNDTPDFTKPCWAGISEEAKDFCRMLLNRDVAARPTAKDALKHPWLQGNSAERSTGKRIGQSVVARIQRFAAGSQLKRTVQQSIAAELLSQPQLLSTERDRCVTSAAGRAIIAAPDSACLELLMSQLRLDRGGAVMDEEQLGEVLTKMGCRLAPSEVSRLMEQVDLEGSGEIDRAAFAASQMDWRHLQRNHAELWLDLAARAFRSMDKDGNGVLEVEELLEALRARLPAEEVQAAMEAALHEAALHEAHTCPGGEVPQGIDFEAFVSLLKVGSMDSLDLYDDRMSSRSGGSVNGSMDRLNGLLAASLRSGDWSRHGPGDWSRHGPGGLGLASEASAHSHSSERSEMAAPHEKDSSQHAPTQVAQPQRAPGGVAFRFDVGGTDAAASGKSKPAGGAEAGVGNLHGVASGGRAAGDGVSGGMAWRFDVAGRPAAPPPPPPSPPVWRFDVSGGGRASWEEPNAGATAGRGGPAVEQGGRSAAAAALGGGGIAGLGRQGGYFDRRMHGSNLYRNVALPALHAAGHRACLGTVAE